ncbi:ABC transporter substrate-binding protein [Vineibacter terrae]|uniref:ABC transporter substrate-binding protein n=1 Tax=Vineibacter terrae TaxID=2586908 RepID=UPI002E30C0F0|nr:ABC transporter substrate-binding protein [Vineibacter terrae]HEX2891613.1 ABC transporter substrate-binding protein [Vineibacter terrae]
MRTTLLAAAALALAALINPPQGAAADLKLGVIAPLSGGGTDWGIGTQRGVELAVDEINAAGGLRVGNETYRVSAVTYDDQYSGQGGTTAATRLIEGDGVKFIFGPLGSTPVLAAQAVAAPGKAVILSSGYSPRILTPQGRHNFRVTLATPEFAPAFIGWLRRTNAQAKRVGIISPNDATGQSVVPILVDAYKKAGFEVVLDEKVERGTSDFTPLVTRMIAQRIEVIELDSSTPGDAGLIVKQARQLGYRGIIMQTGGPAIDEVVNIAGGLAEGYTTMEWFDSSSPEAAPLVAAYRAKYGKAPMNAFVPIMYNAAKLLFEAVKRAGSTDVTAVSAELEKLEGHPSLFGAVRWGGQERYGINHQLMTDFFIAQVKQGKPTVIDRVRP